jgi:hypothetical protein
MNPNHDPHDSHTIPSRPPLTFSQLPQDVRAIIYTELFSNPLLEADSTFFRYPEVDQTELDKYENPVYRSGNLPAILLTSKPIRSEALPIFSAALTVATLEPSLHLVARIPSHYRARAKTLLATWEFHATPTQALLPCLDRVYLYYQLGPAWAGDGSYSYIQSADPTLSRDYWTKTVIPDAVHEFARQNDGMPEWDFAAGHGLSTGFDKGIQLLLVSDHLDAPTSRWRTWVS